MSTTIVTLGEFAYAIHSDQAGAARHQLLLELAEGLVVDELGEQDTYSVTVKSVVLEAATRAYFNFKQAGCDDTDPKSATEFVRLTDDEIARLHGRTARGPQFSFPTEWSYPDPVEAPTDTVSWP
jgi:hypothetical protein